MAAVGTLDLASVTDAIIAALQAAVDSSPLWGVVPRIEIKVTGESPDLARTSPDGRCRLSLSLIHVAPDASYRNRSFQGSGGIVTPPEPMALTLTYVLVAFAERAYVEEQQAMSTALAWIVSHPIQRLIVTAAPPHSIECTLTIETATLDEIARLWQSLTGAMRLTALLRVAVVFLGSEAAPGPPAEPPTEIGLFVLPKPALIAASGPGGPDDAVLVSAFGLAGDERLFLDPPGGGAGIEVTAWVTERGRNFLQLKLPPVAGIPPPGLYRLRIGAPEGAFIRLEIEA